MLIAGTPPELSQRAREQLHSLASDVQAGYARLRVITRNRNQLQGDLLLSKQRLDEMEARHAYLKQRGEAGSSNAAGEAERLEPEVRRVRAEAAGIQERIAVMNREEAGIQAWLHPHARIVEGIVEHLGLTRIEQLLPDFGIEYQSAK